VLKLKSNQFGGMKIVLTECRYRLLLISDIPDVTCQRQSTAVCHPLVSTKLYCFVVGYLCAQFDQNHWNGWESNKHCLNCESDHYTIN